MGRHVAVWQFKCGVCRERRDRLRGDGHVIQLRVGRTPDGVPRRRRLKKARPAIIHSLSDRFQGLDDVLRVTHRAFPSTDGEPLASHHACAGFRQSDCWVRRRPRSSRAGNP